MEVGSCFMVIPGTLSYRAGVLHVGIEGQPSQPGNAAMTKPVQIEKEALRLPTIDPGVRIGHVHLKVADLQRALDFYCGVLGFTLTTSRPGAAFISAGGHPHPI